MYKRIQDIAAGLFITFTAIFTVVAILAVWDLVAKDALEKSMTTIGILAFGALIVIIAARVIDKRTS